MDVSDQKNFFNFLNFFKNNKLHKSDILIYDTISNISRSESDFEPLINSDCKLINFDALSRNAYMSNNGKEKQPQPLTVDALYYNFDKSNEDNIVFKLYFIEFKGIDLFEIDYKQKLKVFKKILKDNNCSYKQDINSCPSSETNINHLEKIYNRYEDEIISKLKLKPFESFFIALPEIYKEYCSFLEIPQVDQIKDFKSFLMNDINTYLVIVGVDNRSKVTNKIEINYKGKLTAKYSLLTPKIFTNCQIYDKEDFNNDLLKEIEKNPI